MADDAETKAPRPGVLLELEAARAKLARVAEKRAGEMPDPEFFGAEVQPSSDVSSPAQSVDPDRAAIVWGDQLDTDDPPVPWVCEGLAIGPGRPNVLAGEGGSMKSMLAQYLGLCVISGQKLFGRHVVRAGRVLYVDYEQGLRVTKARFRRFSRVMGISLSEHKDAIGYLYRPFFLDAMQKADRLARLVEGFDLVIVDSARRSAPSLKENDKEASMPLDIMAGVSEKLSTSFLCLDHASVKGEKRGRHGNRKAAQMGHSAKLDGSGTMYVLTRDEKTDPVLVTCEREQNEGEYAADFCFNVKDVVDPRVDPSSPVLTRLERKWGLEAFELASEAADPPQAPAEVARERASGLEQVAARLLDLIKRQPGISSATLEELAPKMRHTTFTGAVDHLKATGQIENRTGKRTRTEWVAK